jgi:hypothetical protein
MGVTSLIRLTSRPADCSDLIAVSRPEPGPFTKTSTSRIPWSIATRAACSAAMPAANGVLLREPLKPWLPALDQDITDTARSVMVTMVLLNVDLMCAMPLGIFLRSRRLVRTPFFGLANAAPPPLNAYPPKTISCLLFAAHSACRTLASTCISTSALSACWQTAPMP